MVKDGAASPSLPWVVLILQLVCQELHYDCCSMKKGHKFRWIREVQEAFEKLNALISLPLLTYPDPLKPSIVQCNASDDGIGGVLSPKCDDVE